eukprot:TRINITY_DN6608_c1_g2_i1.p1 TRINITY_DN6608_c1_g2~~TRINITY_DN6608_c1_g2_i1.p1  ORF type:complete len:1829 (-),score=575.17 TRINITY_DN6608_c1_g2_i1:19-5268(-)
MDAQTTGFWMWARKHPRNEDVTILLMDTEGLDSPHIPQWYNWTLASLALLISTFFIYQSKGSIDSSATDRLAVILKVAEQIAGEKLADTDRPRFLWLIRDAQLQFKKTPREEMLSMLDRTERRQLESYFDDNYDCFPLPRPVENEAMLKEVEKLEWNELRNEFREEYAVLERQIFTSIQSARKLSGQTITGDLIALLFEKYITSISEKGIMSDLSQLPTQQQMVVKMAGERGVKAALQEYTAAVIEQLEGKLPINDTELFEKHDLGCKKARQVFLNIVNAVGDNIPKDVQEYYDLYNSKIAKWLSVINSDSDGNCFESKKLISGLYFDLLQKNSKLTKEKCEIEIRKVYQPILEKLKDIPTHYPTLQDYLADIDAAKKEYHNNLYSVGSCKEKVFDEYVSSVSSDHKNRISLVLLENKLLSVISNQNTSIETFRSSIQTELKTSNQNLSSELSKVSSQLETTSKNLSSLITENQQQTTSVSQQLQKEIKTVQDHLVSQIEQVTKNHIESEKKLSSKIEEGVEKHNTFVEKTNTRVTQINDELRDKITSLVESTALKNSEIVSKMNDQSESQREKLSELKSTTDTKIKELSTNFEQLVTSKYSKLEETTNNKYSELSTKITEQNNDLQSKLTQQKDNITAKLSENVETLDNKITSLTQSTTTNIRDLDEKLTTKLSSTQNELRTEYNQKFTSMTTNIDTNFTYLKNFEVSITENYKKLDQLHSDKHKSITDTLTQLESSTTGKFTDLNKDIDGKLNALEVATKKSMETINEKIVQEHTYFEQQNVTMLSQISKGTTSLQTHIDSLSASLSELQKSSSATIKEVQTQLGNELSTVLSKQKSDYTELQSKQDGIITSFKESNEELKRSINDVSVRVESNKNDLSSLSKALESNRASLNEQNQECTSIKINLSDVVTKISKLNELVDTNHESTKSQFKQHNESIQSQFNQHNESIQSQFNQHNESVHSKLTSNIEEVQNKIIKMNDSIQIIEKSTQQLQSSNTEELDKLKSSVNQIITTSNEMNTSISQHKQQLEEFVVNQKELKDLVNTKLKDTTDSFNTILSGLESKLSDSTTQFDAKNKEILQKVERADSNHTQHAELITKVNNDVSNLRQVLDGLNIDDKIRSLETKSTALSNDLSQISLKNDNIVTSLSTIVENIGAHEQKFNAISTQFAPSSQIVEIWIQLKESTSKLTHLESTLTELNTNQSSLSTSARDNVAKLDQQIQDIISWKDNYTSSASSSSLSSSSIETMNQQLRSLEKTIEEIKSTNSTTQSQLNKSLESISLFEKKLESTTSTPPPPPYQQLQQSPEISLSQVDGKLQVIQDSISGVKDKVAKLESDIGERIGEFEEKIGLIENQISSSNSIKPDDTTTTKSTSTASPSSPGGPPSYNEIQLKKLEDTYKEKFKVLEDLREQIASTIELVGAHDHSINDIKKTQISKLEGSIITLQNATKSTFANVEKSLGILRQNIEKVNTVTEEIKRSDSTNRSSSSPTSPSSSFTDPSMSSSVSNDVQSLEQSMLKAIAGMTATNTRYTDSAIEGLAQNISNLKRQMNEELKSRLDRLEQYNPQQQQQPPPPYPGSVDNLNSKFDDVYMKLENLSILHSQLSNSLQDLQRSVPLVLPGADDQMSISKFKDMIEDQIREQRKNLVAAMKTHVTNVEKDLKTDMMNMIGQIEQRINAVSSSAGFSNPQSPSNVGTGSGGSSSVLAVEAKLLKTQTQMDHLKSSVEGLWNSLGALSAKVAEIESELDK